MELKQLTLYKTFSNTNFKSTYVFLDNNNIIHFIPTTNYRVNMNAFAINTKIALDQIVEMEVTYNTFYLIYNNPNNTKVFYLEFHLDFETGSTSEFKIELISPS